LIITYCCRRDSISKGRLWGRIKSSTPIYPCLSRNVATSKRRQISLRT
jgi:hypothetical protein